MKRRTFLAGVSLAAILAAWKADAFLPRGGVYVASSTFTSTTRIIRNRSASVAMATGSKVRFGIGFAYGDIPSGSILSVVDAANNPITFQTAGMRRVWPDGSLKWCEVRCLTARSIAASGSETLTISKAAGTWTALDALPASLTVANVLTAVQSFTGAQDLSTNLAVINDGEGIVDANTTGNWPSHFNTAAAGSKVQIINSGPCCLGIWAFDDLGNPVLSTHWLVWIWLNPSTGAITDVEYMPRTNNGYDTVPTIYGRFNYTYTVKNQSTTLRTISSPGSASPFLDITSHSISGGVDTCTTATPHGLTNGQAINIDTIYGHTPSSQGTVEDITPITVINATTFSFATAASSWTGGAVIGLGGHGEWRSWWDAQTNGHTWWVSGNSIQYGVTLDSTAYAYLVSTGLIPALDQRLSAIMPASGYEGTTYAPFSNGVYGNMFNHKGWDNAGASPWLGLLPLWAAQSFIMQPSGYDLNTDAARCDCLASMMFPNTILDNAKNGKFPNLAVGTFTGLGTAKTLMYWGRGNTSRNLITFNYSYANAAAGTDNWSAPGHDVLDTSHWPSRCYYTFLMEGGWQHMECLMADANNTIGMKCSSTSIDSATPVRQRHLGYYDTTGTLYNGVLIGNGVGRIDAWSLRTVMWAEAILPDTLADGTAFGERSYFTFFLQNTAQWIHDYLTTYISANAKAIGAWYQIMAPNAETFDVPWMMGYLAMVAPQWYKLAKYESWAANVATLCGHLGKFLEGMTKRTLGTGGYRNSFIGCYAKICGPMSLALGADVVPSWDTIGMELNLAGTSDQNAYFTFQSGNPLLETSNGTSPWGTLAPAVGDVVVFMSDSGGGGGFYGLPAGFEFSVGVPYYIVRIVSGTQLAFSATPGGAEITPTQTTACGMFVIDLPASNPPVVFTSHNGYPVDANAQIMLACVRNLRGAGFDSTALAHFDSENTTRIGDTNTSQWTLPLGNSEHAIRSPA